MFAPPSPPNRRMVVSVDMQSYSHRDNIAQYQAQQIFHDVIAAAVCEVGLDRSAWTTQQGGDSELAILPSDISEPAVLGRLAPRLDRMLRDVNRNLLPAAKVRLRMAVHEGLVHLDGANGYPGDAVNVVSRLRDARCLKRALAAFPNAGLALIVSGPIYRDVVAQRYEGINSDRFRKVLVDEPEKKFQAEAWICVMDEDVTTIDLAEPDAVRNAAEAPSPSAPATSKYNIGSVTSTGAFVMGDSGVAYNMVRPEEMP